MAVTAQEDRAEVDRRDWAWEQRQSARHVSVAEVAGPRFTLLPPPSFTGPLVQRATNRKFNLQFIFHALKWSTVRGLTVIALPLIEADEDYPSTHPNPACDRATPDRPDPYPPGPLAHDPGHARGLGPALAPSLARVHEHALALAPASDPARDPARSTLVRPQEGRNLPEGLAAIPAADPAPAPT